MIPPDRKMNWAPAGEKITFISHGKSAELREKREQGGQGGGAGMGKEG